MVLRGAAAADWGARSGFDQNRVLVGVNWKLDAARRFEIGYLNQLVRTSADDLMNHVLSATFFVDFAKLGDTP